MRRGPSEAEASAAAPSGPIPAPPEAGAMRAELVEAGFAVLVLPAAACVALPLRAPANTAHARSAVAESITKRERNETVARSPPTAGPMLIPMLMARRISATADLRCSGDTAPARSAIAAGRKASFTTAHKKVRARIAE